MEADGNEGAAAFAYYLLLSFLPLVILLVTAGSLFAERDVATQAVVQWVKHYVPLTGEQEHSAVGTIGGMLAARGQISLVVIPFLLWSALQLLGMLIRTTNRLWHSKAYNWWKLPLKSLALLGITVSAVLIGILLPGMTHPKALAAFQLRKTKAELIQAIDRLLDQATDREMAVQLDEKGFRSAVGGQLSLADIVDGDVAQGVAEIGQCANDAIAAPGGVVLDQCGFLPEGTRSPLAGVD